LFVKSNVLILILRSFIAFLGCDDLYANFLTQRIC
jgi:hypothetical protein